MRRSAPGPHQACRSLLQKAVRRGDLDVLTRVAEHLESGGEGRWLRARAHVIAFEECWPLLGAASAPPTEPTALLTLTARAVKRKDAAGLGALAYAFSQGDPSALAEGDEHAVRVVASGLARPKELWNWCRREARDAANHSVVLAAQSSYGYAAWPWDKALLLAAAYLAATGAGVQVSDAGGLPLPCPLWVALDRHTDVGRKVLRAVAAQAKLPYLTVAALSFYFEGALTNEEEPAGWWEREVRRRLKLLGLEAPEAKRMWASLRPRVEEELAPAATALATHLSAPGCA